jgi:hypothetical protein
LLHDFRTREREKTQNERFRVLTLVNQKNKQLNEKIEEELVMKGHKCRIFTKNIDEHG